MLVHSYMYVSYTLYFYKSKAEKIFAKEVLSSFLSSFFFISAYINRNVFYFVGSALHMHRIYPVLRGVFLSLL